MLFAGFDNDWSPKQLFTPKEDWEPDINELPREFRSRVNSFLQKLGTQFIRKRATPNLTRHQQRLLEGLQNSEELIVLPSDKNLGPCIIERTKYIQAALDHLSDAATYERLDPNDALQSIIGVEQNIIKFLGDYHHSISKDDNTFLWRSLEVQDKFSYFYITAKVHKTPWKPRPITSTAGSITHGLGRWVDQELKPIVKKLPSYIRSSAHLLERFKAINYDPSNVSFFSCDAVSMYTNIDTAHALEVLHPFFRTSPLCAGCQADALTVALEILMRQNVFKFGDTFWRQKSGTAMGTPPGANYAELYYGTWEIDFADYFRTSLALYCRYIDDGIGLWIHHPDPHIDQLNFAALQATMNSFGSLEWEFTALSKTIDFMDVRLTITPTGIKSTLYEKPMNLYLYLPPLSAHAPGVLRGLIIGMTKRIYALTTELPEREQALRRLFLRLRNRGYDPVILKPLFQLAISKAHSKRATATDSDDDEKRCFLHLTYHPQDPSSQSIQKIFRKTLLKPHGEPALPDLCSFKGARLETNRMIVAYHRPNNLKNLLFPRTLREPDGKPASSFIPPTLAIGTPL
jgi:hypothetical protein